MLRYAGFSASPANVDHEGMLPDQLELALLKRCAGGDSDTARA